MPPALYRIRRREDVREIAATLGGGGSLVIAGPRRTGKTSVCDALGLCQRKGAYTVSVDLFRIANAAELAEVLVAQTIANRSDPCAASSTKRGEPDGLSPRQPA